MSNEALRLREIINKIKDHNLLKDRSCKNIRETIEDLGPTFIKMGQILSARDDLVSKELCDELKKLRCSVKPMDYDEVLDILNAEYNGNYQEIFAEIEDVPLGSASIAQTHRAKLKTGEDVVLKIQRKNIYQMMMMDTRLLKKAISILQLDKVVGNIVDLKEIVDEVYSSAKEEMNFMVEAEHIEEFENYNKNVMYIRPLKVYKKYSTPYVLVMECVGGCFINEKAKLDRLGYNMNEIALKLADNYIKQAIDDGFFHADPHADNIKIIDGKIAYLDFGMMGRLSSKNKNLLNKCIVAIIKNDIVEVAHILSLLNVNDSNIDYMKLNSDIRMVLDKNKTLEINDIDIKDFMKDMFSMLHNNDIKLPKDISMLVRGIVVLEGTLEEIDSTISLMQVLKNRFNTSKIMSKEKIESGLVKILENSDSLVSMPKEMLTTLKGINNGELRFNIEINDSKNQVNRFEELFHQGIIAALDLAMIIGLSVMVVVAKDKLPFLFYVYALFALVATTFLFYKIFKFNIRKK